MSGRTDGPSQPRGPHAPLVELVPAAPDAQRAEFLALAATQQAKLRDAWASVNAQAEALKATPADLRDEILRLDARATNARAALRQIETQAEVAALVPADAVALVGHADSASFLADLAERETEVRRSESYLARAREELERHAAAVHDERMVAAETVAGFVAARDRWRQAECDSVAEMERLAAELAEREAQQAEADAGRLQRAQDLWALYQKLEAWQAALAEREAAVAGRERAAEAAAS